MRLRRVKLAYVLLLNTLRLDAAACGGDIDLRRQGSEQRPSSVLLAGVREPELDLF